MPVTAIETKSVKQVVGGPAWAAPILKDIGDAVHKELVKDSPSNVLLESYSKLYTSLAAVMGLYSTSETSFSLKRTEWIIIGVWFVGLIATAGLAILLAGLL